MGRLLQNCILLLDVILIRLDNFGDDTKRGIVILPCTSFL